MALPFSAGDYVVAVSGEDVKHFNSSDTLLEGLYGAPTAQPVRGMVFDGDRNLYVRINPLIIHKWLADGSGPTTIWDSTSHVNIPVVGKLITDGTYLYFSDSVASDTLPHVYKLDLDGNLLDTLVTLPDELPDTTYGVNTHLFGLSVDGATLYGDYGRFDGSTVAHTTVFATPVATDVPAIVLDELAPEGPPGEIWDIIPLPDGSFAVSWTNDASLPHLKRYDNSWSFVEDIAEETAGGLIVNGVTHFMEGGAVPPELNTDIMLALGPDGTKLLFGVAGITTSEIWEYDLASKTITTKHVTGAGAAIRSFAFTVTCTPALLLATTGDSTATEPKLLRRVGDAWATVYTAPGVIGTVGAIRSLIADPSDLRRAYALHLSDAGTYPNDTGLRTHNGGMSWESHNAEGNVYLAVDEDSGDLFAPASSTSTDDVIKSTDQGDTWSVILNNPGSSAFQPSVWHAEGWLWFLDVQGGGGTAYALKRVRSDGTGLETVTVTTSTQVNYLRGTPGVNTFYVVAREANPASGDLNLRIDVSGDTYTIDTIPVFDFGYPDNLVRDLVPLSATRAMLHTSDSVADEGALYVTTDGGETWMLVTSHANLRDLGAAPYFTLAVRPDALTHLAAIGRLPSYWESTNSGASWTEKTVSIVNATDDVQWNTIGWTSTCAAGGGGGGGGGGGRRRHSWAQLVG